MAQRGRSRFNAQREGALRTDEGRGAGLNEAVPPSWEDPSPAVRSALMCFWMFQNQMTQRLAPGGMTLEKLSS